MEKDYNLALKEYGLSENEIKVYIVLLKIGESNVQFIAKNANLPRTTTYHLLESLNKEGLVTNVTKGSIKFFQAIKPNILSQRLLQKKKFLDSVMPELNLIAGTISKKPQIEVFEGIQGIRNILIDVLEEENEILHYGDVLALQNNLQYIFPQFIVQRVKNKIPIRIIGKKEEIHKELLKTAKQDYRLFRFLPEDYTFKTEIFLYKHKVAIINLNLEPYYGIVIDNKDYFDTEKNVFDLLWRIAKK